MVWLLTIITVILVLVFLTTARFALRALPDAEETVPEYILWLPEERPVPPLEPPPERIVIGDVAPKTDKQVLILGPGVAVTPDLPGRLAACGSDFVSVMPVPETGIWSVSAERTLRDLVNGPRVNDPKDVAAYADERCTWLNGTSLQLPTIGGPPALAAARARKLHGLSIDLRDGRAETQDAPIVQAVGHERSAQRLIHSMSADPAARWFAALFLILCNVVPLLAVCWVDTRELAFVAIAVLTSSRILTALREGFGSVLAIFGWITELFWAFTLIQNPSDMGRGEMPTIPSSAPPKLTGSEATGDSMFDQSAVLYLARRLGGSGLVMDRLYDCDPAGSTAFGRMVDRWAHWSPVTRAVRWRWLIAGELVRRLGARSALSVPCGTARDVRWSRVPSPVLVDPDPAAREVVAERLPEGVVLDGSVDDLPDRQFDCVLYLGLSEYLGDGEVRRHLEVLRSRLGPEGALITSITAEHPHRGFMTQRLGWSTRARTTDNMCDMLEAAGMRVELMEHDPHRIQWVLLARPKLT